MSSEHRNIMNETFLLILIRFLSVFSKYLGGGPEI